MRENDEEFKRLLIAYLEVKKRQHRRKQKKVYFLVAVVSVTVMGLSMVTIGDKQIVSEFTDMGNQFRISSDREGERDDLYEESEEIAIYNDAEEMFGFPVSQVHYLPNATMFKEGQVDAKEQSLQVTYVVQYTDYYFVYRASKDLTENTGKKADSLKVEDVSISIYTSDGTRTAYFEYRGLHYSVTSNLIKSEFYKVLESVNFT